MRKSHVSNISTYLYIYIMCIYTAANSYVAWFKTSFFLFPSVLTVFSKHSIMHDMFTAFTYVYHVYCVYYVYCVYHVYCHVNMVNTVNTDKHRLCLSVFICVYLCLPVFTMFTMFTIFTCVYLCLPVFTVFTVFLLFVA